MRENLMAAMLGTLTGCVVVMTLTLIWIGDRVYATADSMASIEARFYEGRR